MKDCGRVKIVDYVLVDNVLTVLRSLAAKRWFHLLFEE